MIDINELFERYFSLKKLHEITDNTINKNTARGIDNIDFDSFNSRKEENLQIINRKILKNNYKFSNYREKLILKSRNSNPRLISIPTIRDRIVLKVIHNILKEIYPNVQQKLPHIHIEELSKNYENYNYYLKIDISNFYGSISHGILINILKETIDYYPLLDIICQSITNPTISIGQKVQKTNREFIGVPQGIPISNFLASLYMLELDKKYKNKSDIFYVRYVDDIIILCDKARAKSIHSEILYDLEGLLNLKVNQEKTVQGDLNHNMFNFLGYTFSKNKKSELCVSVRNQSKMKLEKSIVDIFYSYENNEHMLPQEFIFRLNNKITGSLSQVLHPNEEKEVKRYGWLFYFSQINDFTLLYHLDAFVIKLFSKYDKCNRTINKSEIKSFVKSYYEIKYNIKETKYIHTPDKLNISEKRSLLFSTFNIKRAFTIPKDHVDAIYYQKVYRPIRKEYQDIQKFIS